MSLPEFFDGESEQARVSGLTRDSRDREAWQAVAHTAAGRRVLRSMILLANPLAGCAVSDHGLFAYREGQRSISRHIINEVRMHAPEHFPTLFMDEDYE